MIDSVTGQVAAITKQYVVVVVGGVGLRVHVPTSVRDLVDGPGHTVTLYTHLHVREDGLILYGFAEQEERALFETLITISGVGPRIALALLSTLTVEHIHNAVAREEPDVLTRVPGIGKKLAQKLIFELKDKLVLEPSLGVAALSDIDTDVIATLTALGYSVVEAQTALQAIPRDAPADIEERVRLALQYFA
ncbi:MAG: Holliday junction branch migration protein RuvA [Anaerolineae bacterium]|nr:Holliday junction branch migration protein RuvA [Anaerolineae bacterium]